MTVMGDATHSNVAVLAKIGGLSMVAGYDTGTPDIVWTSGDWALFPGIPHVHIDQGYDSTPVIEAHVIVFDVESGAWAPGSAGPLIAQNTSPRPTPYVNQSNMAATLASALTAPNYRGDVWLSLPGWQPGQPLPALPVGCRYVAIQNALSVAGAYDLSTVLDPTWPGGSMPASIQAGWAWCSKCAGLFYAGSTPSAGVCPAGGQHAGQGSFDYALVNTPPES